MTEILINRDPRDKGKPTRAYDRWNAYYKGELIVEGSVDPEHAAARFLAAHGVKGKALFRHRHDNYVSMTLDIEKAAKKSAQERSKDSVRIGNFPQKGELK